MQPSLERALRHKEILGRRSLSGNHGRGDGRHIPLNMAPLFSRNAFLFALRVRERSMWQVSPVGQVLYLSY